MPSTEPAGLSSQDRDALLRVARESIAHGLEYGHPLTVDPFQFSEPLQVACATFVTLKQAGQLRGCVGALEASRPLVQDVAQNAYAAAFRDPRFPALTGDEAAALHIHIAVLSSAQPLEARDEADLLRQLRPGIDGLILEEEHHRSTFLPAVWAQISDPATFVRELKQKAGLAPDYWSDTLRVYRYTTESFPV
ncbi:MAG: AMMECR1 domain-containing protein [Chromatiales bacterium 21-64-14]|nr:MAG: AMMECR1 domain-containing protein [Chromatiales bacterium 21-64-14]HQU15053.1 AmmeMemoRadiSam system protein A [Gammaproteobacteria bacterium]